DGSMEEPGFYGHLFGKKDGLTGSANNLLQQRGRHYGYLCLEVPPAGRAAELPVHASEYQSFLKRARDGKWSGKARTDSDWRGLPVVFAGLLPALYRLRAGSAFQRSWISRLYSRAPLWAGDSPIRVGRRQ